MSETKVLRAAIEGHSSAISHKAISHISISADITGQLHILDYSYTKPLYQGVSLPGEQAWE